MWEVGLYLETERRMAMVNGDMDGGGRQKAKSESILIFPKSKIV